MKTISRNTARILVLAAAACCLLASVPPTVDAQRIAPFSRLKKKFGRLSGNGNGKFIMEQGEDENTTDSNFFTAAFEVLKGMGKTPGTLITVVAFAIAYVCAMVYQDRVEELEQKLHQRYKRQNSAEGECTTENASTTHSRDLSRLPLSIGRIILSRKIFSYLVSPCVLFLWLRRNCD